VKSYRPYAPDQSFLLPPSPREWLPTGHLVFFVIEFVSQLDLGAIERRLQAADHRGERPYSPRMMTALLLYGYATGVYSSRRLQRATVEDVAFRVLVNDEQPHFTTINQFRATHRDALSGLFVQVLEACQSAGLVKLGHVAIDGTKMKANASKHKAMSYDRIVKDTARLRAEVEGWMARAEAEDAADDELHGPHDPKEEIRLREERLAMNEVALALKLIDLLWRKTRRNGLAHGADFNISAWDSNPVARESDSKSTNFFDPFRQSAPNRKSFCSPLMK
jgi:transposase